MKRLNCFSCNNQRNSRRVGTNLYSETSTVNTEQYRIVGVYFLPSLPQYTLIAIGSAGYIYPKLPQPQLIETGRTDLGDLRKTLDELCTNPI
jgi:hypothetical protein